MAAPRVRAQAPSAPTEPKTQRAFSELEAWAKANRARVSALAAYVHSGAELGLALPDQALNPASNQKILTLIAAFDVLGPAHRFTSLLAGRAGSPEWPELVLRGDGDPELSSADLAAMADALAQRAPRRIQGDLFVDQSAFDTRWDPPGYEQRPNDWAAYRAPVSAVAVDRNAVTLHVAPETVGKAARVWFEPAGLVSVLGEVRTVGPREPRNVRLTVRSKGELLEGHVGGEVPEGAGVLTFSRRIAAPELAAGHVLAAQLAARGFSISGGVRAGGSGVTGTLVVHRSRPLAQIAHALGKSSDNFCAEMLLKAVGAKASGGPGTTAAGIAAIEQYMKRIGAFGTGLELWNGSGLYGGNRLSARSLVRALTAAYGDPRIGPELVASLAIGGTDGTLSQRFSNLRGERRLRAKTGTLADVVALAGYLLGPGEDRTIAFAILLNGVAGKTGEARRRIDSVVAALAS